jgi:thioredoxin-dependent peroxiredoxin
MKKSSKSASKKVTKKVAKKTVKKVSAKKAPSKKTSKKVAKKQSAALIRSGIPQVGDKAPEFSLQDQNGNTVSLKDFKGMNVVVYFYPKAMTPGCTVQACGLRDTDNALKDLDVVVLGISADPVKKLKQFEEKEKLNFTLLSDPDHKVAEAYGSWGLKKFMGREFMGILRQSFFVDKAGKIAHVMHKVDTKTHHQDVVNFFKHL